jgi:hypothetical protein
MNLVLIQNGYTPAVIQNKKRINYLDALESWQQNNNNNKEKFYKIIIEYEKESLEKYLETIKKKNYLEIKNRIFTVKSKK